MPCYKCISSKEAFPNARSRLSTLKYNVFWYYMYVNMEFIIHCQILLDSHMYIRLKWHSKGINSGHKSYKIPPVLFLTLSSELIYVEMAACSCSHPGQQAVDFCSWNDTTGFLLDIAICFFNLKQSCVKDVCHRL